MNRLLHLLRPALAALVTLALVSACGVPAAARQPVTASPAGAVRVGTPLARALPSATPAPSAKPGPSATPTRPPAAQIPAVWTYKVVNTYPHDPSAFTQGLVYEDNQLFEGTGLYGESTLRRVQLETGAVVVSKTLAPEYFGEGITVFGDRIIQLTWQSQTGFVYDKADFRLLQTFSYPSEGWGLTDDGQRLIMSDGTSTLRFLDPQTLTETGRIEVLDGDQPVTNINELEYIGGEIFANIWLTDRIARISPQTGKVLGWIDLAGLMPLEERTDPQAVLNGIAYDPSRDRLFVTGKLWPRLFEIDLVRPAGAVPGIATTLPLVMR